MKREFYVKIDVTMSGDYYVQADSKEEAIKIALEKKFKPDELKNFYFFDSNVDDVEEV